MHRIISIFAFSVALVALAAWAGDNYGGSSTEQPGASGADQGAPGGEQPGVSGQEQPGATGQEQPGQAPEATGTTVTSAEEVTKGMLSREKVGIRPQLGTLVFDDQFGNSAARFAAGLTIDMNALSTLMGESKWYAGPSSGIIYSHVGQSGQNWFGAGSSGNSAAASGANFFYIPINLKVGYSIADRYRVAAHGGGNYTYRSVGQAMDFGPSTAVANSTWRMYPNVGLDLEAGVAKNVALTLRPDLMFTPGADLFTGTLAVAIGLG